MALESRSAADKALALRVRAAIDANHLSRLACSLQRRSEQALKSRVCAALPIVAPVTPEKSK